MHLPSILIDPKHQDFGPKSLTFTGFPRGLTPRILCATEPPSLIGLAQGTLGQRLSPGAGGAGSR